MGYYDEPSSLAEKIGQRIYHTALEDRRGFRPDQIGIDKNDSVWGEIFSEIGIAAIESGY